MSWTTIPQRILSRSLRLTFGKGWMYRFPKYYDKVITHRMDAVREEAFDYFLNKYAHHLAGERVCLDLACGTGLTSVGLAGKTKDCRVIGVDQSSAMLRQAAQRARKGRLDTRCEFAQANAHELSLESLAPFLGENRQTVDVITCALGFSVIPEWEAAFHTANTLLHNDGLFVIFDDYTPQLYLPEFDANQSRKSWELVERNFTRTEVKWFGDMFIAIGQGKASDE